MSDAIEFQLNPVKVRNRLIGNPNRDPLFFKKYSLKNGAEIQISSPSHNRALVALMDMQAVLGGAASHWGGPAAFAEIMSSIYGYCLHDSKESNCEWYEKFHIINDAGHCENGIYALKANYGMSNIELQTLKGFRSIESCLTGHGEAHIFPESVYLSNGPLGSSLAQAQGLAFADRLSGSQRTTVAAISDGACMEGEAKEALAAIPGLAAKGKLNPFVLVISDNNTKLSGRIDEQSFSMSPTFESLSQQGWSVITLKEGNNLEKSIQAIEEAITLAKKSPTKPIAMIATTVKGYGVKSTMDSASGGHGFPLKTPKDLNAFVNEILEGEEVPEFISSWIDEMIEQESQAEKSKSSEGSTIKAEKAQVGISQALIRKAEEGLPIYSISSDLPGSTGVAGFQKAFSKQCVDVGIAESNMVSMASGLSKVGYIPIVDTFAQFGVTKGALPLTMGALSEAPVIAIFSHVGFQDAADGASHQALTYYAMTSSIPNTEVYHVTCSFEADTLLGQAIEKFHTALKEGRVPKSYVFFLGRENFPQHFDNKDLKFELGKAQVVFDNTDKIDNAVTIVATGACLFQAIEAAKTMEEKGKGAIVINPSIISKPDVETISAALKKTDGKLLTVEEHQIIGGMGATLCQSLALKNIKFDLKSLGVEGKFGQSAYKANELYTKHGMDAAAIEKVAFDLI